MFTKKKKNCVFAIMSFAKNAKFIMKKSINNTAKKIKNSSSFSFIDSDIFENCVRSKTTNNSYDE